VAKSRIVLVLIVALLLVGMLAMVVPGTASADVWPVDWQWQNPTYYGYDSYYGSTVNEYAEGATATLPVFLYNNPYYAYGDATIKSATLKMDWGLEVAGTGVPAVLPYYEGSVINFSFTVPSVSVATNAWAHSYEVVIEYETDSYQHKVNFYPWDYLGAGNAAQTAFGMDSSPVVPSSEKVFLVNGAAGTVDVAATTAYTVNNATGVITFNTAPAVGIAVYAQYEYMEYEGTGTGETTVFWTGESPIAPDSEVIYLYNGVSNSIALVANTAYTLDDETGRIVFNTAPQPYEYVYASYDIYESSSWYTTWGGEDFVVLSADQSAWYGLEQQYGNMADWFYSFNSTKAKSLAMEADYNNSLAWDAYDAGNFAAARSFETTAVDKLNAAVAAEVEFDQIWETQDLVSDNAGIAQTLSTAAENNGYAAYYNGMASKADEEAALLTAQTDQIKALTDAQKSEVQAQATKAKGWGTFLILLGVGVLLVGVAILVLAVSMLMTARKKPAQTT